MKLAVVVAAVYGAVAMLFAPFTLAQHVATAVPCVAMLTAAVLRGWHRPGAKPGPGPDVRHRAGVAVWLVLITLAVTVQLLNYFEWPRDVYPTLSSLASQVFSIYPVRVVAFWAWLGLGWYILER
ncbi:MAG: hypothetical protein AB1673_16540 [Actinomycetota bacterium]